MKNSQPMIKPQELRIGNRVNQTYTVLTTDEHGIEIIEGQDVASNIWIEKENIKPIPLTKDWLLRFGFQEIPEKYPRLSKGDFEIVKFNEEHDWELQKDYGEHYLTPITDVKYVHALQNLIHSLTGEELTIKQHEHTSTP